MTDNDLPDDLPEAYKDLPVMVADETARVDGSVAGLSIVVWVVFGFLIVSIPIVIFIVWLSRTQEKHRRRVGNSASEGGKGKHWGLLC